MLYATYASALETKKDSGVPFGRVESLVNRITERENAMHSYLRSIIFKLLPISFVVDPEVRAFANMMWFSRKDLSKRL